MQEAEEETYIVKGLNPCLDKQPLLNSNWCNITAVNHKELSPMEQFPVLFEGLGILQGDYTIQLQEGAKPFALSYTLAE